MPRPGRWGIGLVTDEAVKAGRSSEERRARASETEGTAAWTGDEWSGGDGMYVCMRECLGIGVRYQGEKGAGKAKAKA